MTAAVARRTIYLDDTDLAPWTVDPRTKEKIAFLPSFFMKSEYIPSVVDVLNACQFRNGRLLCKANEWGNEKLYQAYRFWIMAPIDMQEWARLETGAEAEVELVGRYLRTVERENIRVSCGPNPKWMAEKISFGRKLGCLFLVALTITGIALIAIYSKKKM